MELAGKKLWVTGAGGLLGSALKKYAHAFTGREVDICDIDALRSYLRSNAGITHIINCAAFSLVDKAEEEKEEAYRVNALGPDVLSRLAQENGIRLIHISTDYVFQGDVVRPLREEDEAVPCNYYGWTKLEGERRVLGYYRNACVIRTSWLFGKGGKNFVAGLFALLQQKKEVLLTNDQYGRPTYVPDLVEAILQMLDVSGLYQFANRGETTKYLFGLALKEEAERAGVPMAVQSLMPVPSTRFATLAKRPAYSVFDTSKIEMLLQKPIRHWRDGLREYLA